MQNIPVEVTYQLMEKFKKMNEDNCERFRQEKQKWQLGPSAFANHRDAAVSQINQDQQQEVQRLRKNEHLQRQRLEGLTSEIERMRQTLTTLPVIKDQLEASLKKQEQLKKELQARPVVISESLVKENKQLLAQAETLKFKCDSLEAATKKLQQEIDQLKSQHENDIKKVENDHKQAIEELSEQKEQEATFRNRQTISRLTYNFQEQLQDLEEQKHQIALEAEERINKIAEVTQGPITNDVLGEIRKKINEKVVKLDHDIQEINDDPELTHQVSRRMSLIVQPAQEEILTASVKQLPGQTYTYSDEQINEFRKIYDSQIKELTHQIHDLQNKLKISESQNRAYESNRDQPQLPKNRSSLETQTTEIKPQRSHTILQITQTSASHKSLHNQQVPFERIHESMIPENESEYSQELLKSLNRDKDLIKDLQDQLDQQRISYEKRLQEQEKLIQDLTKQNHQSQKSLEQIKIQEPKSQKEIATPPIDPYSKLYDKLNKKYGSEHPQQEQNYEFLQAEQQRLQKAYNDLENKLIEQKYNYESRITQLLLQQQPANDYPMRRRESEIIPTTDAEVKVRMLQDQIQKMDRQYADSLIRINQSNQQKQIETQEILQNQINILNNEHQKEIQGLKQQIKNKDLEIQKVQGMIQMLNQQLIDHKLKLSEYKNNARLIDLEDKYQKQLEKEHAMKHEFKVQLEWLEEQNTVLNKKLVDLIQQQDHQELDLLKERVIGLESQKLHVEKQLRQTIMASQLKPEQQSQLLVEREQEIDNLRIQINILENTIKQIQSQLQDLGKQHLEVKMKLDWANLSLEEYEGDLKIKNSQINSITQERDRVTKDLRAEIDTMTESHKNQIKQMEDQFKRTEAQYASVEEKLQQTLECAKNDANVWQKMHGDLKVKLQTTLLNHEEELKRIKSQILSQDPHNIPREQTSERDKQINTLQDIITELEEKIQQLEDKLVIQEETLRVNHDAEVRKLRDQMLQYQKQQSELYMNLNWVKANNEELDEEVNELRKENQSLQGKVESESLDDEKLVKQLKLQNEQLQLELEEHKEYIERIDVYKDQILKLTQQLNLVQKDNEELKVYMDSNQQNKTQMENINRIQEEYQQNKIQLSEANERILALEQQLTNQAEQQIIQDQEEKLQQLVNQSNDQNKVLQEQIKTQQSQFVSLEEQLNNIELENQSLKQIANEYKKQIDDLIQQIALAKTGHQEEQIKFEQKQTQLQQNNEDLEKQNTLQKQQLEELTQKQQDLGQSQEKIFADQQQKLQDLESLNQQNQKLIKEQDIKLESLIQQSEQQKVLYEQEQKKVKDLHQEIQELNAEVLEQEQLIEDLRKQIETFKIQAQDDKNNIDNHQSQIQVLKQINDTLQTEISDRNQKIIILTQTIKTSEEDIESLKAQIKELQRQIKKFQVLDENYRTMDRILKENEELKHSQIHNEEQIEDLQKQLLSQSVIVSAQDQQQKQKQTQLENFDRMSQTSSKSNRSKQETLELYKKIGKMSMYTANYLSAKLDYSTELAQSFPPPTQN